MNPNHPPARQCSRCRCLLLTAADAVTIRIGNFPARYCCDDCAEHLQLEAVTPPTLNATIPADLTPSGS